MAMRLLDPSANDGDFLEQRLDIRSQDNGTDCADNEDGEDVFPVDVFHTRETGADAPAEFVASVSRFSARPSGYTPD